MTLHEVDHMMSVAEVEDDPLVERLQSQVARLEYENAKMRVDLINRSVEKFVFLWVRN